MSIKRLNRAGGEVNLAALDKVSDEANTPGPARVPPVAAAEPPQKRGGRSEKSAALPWEAPHVRADVKKKVMLSPAEPLFLKLHYLAEQGAIKSINAYALELLEAGAKAKLKELGVK